MKHCIFINKKKRAMSDNLSARKKLESREKARLAEEARREKIKAQKLRGVVTSEGEHILYILLYKRLTFTYSNLSWS